MYLDPNDPNVEEFSLDAANAVMKFTDLQLKACHIGTPGSIIPSLPAFFLDMTLKRTDETGEEHHFEVHISPEELGEVISMCGRAVACTLQATADEAERTARAIAADMAAMRAERETP